MATFDLGRVTAYAYAVAGGYTGTEAEFEALLGNIAIDLAEIENLSVTVTTLPEGSSATASYADGVLSLGIPKGDTGAQGPQGIQGLTGNGISGIEKTGTTGNVDTYTITYTNGQTTTFTVTNGSVTSVDGQTGDVDLSNKANIDGYYEDLTAGYAENLISNVYDEESVPYNFRTAGGSLDIGSFEYDEVVGGSLAVNQLVDEFTNTNWVSESGVTASFSNGVATISSTTANNGIRNTKSTGWISGHKYLTCAEFYSTSAYTVRFGSTSGAGVVKSLNTVANTWTPLSFVASAETTTLTYIYVYATTTYSNLQVKDFILIDLTQMFGSTIADYIYTLETGQAGAGVAWFKKLFPKSYYPYNAGSLEHVQTSGHKMVGFNQWDEEAEQGGINGSGQPYTPQTPQLRTKNFIDVFPSTVYYRTSTANILQYYYDADENYIGTGSWGKNATFTTPSNAYKMKFVIDPAYGTTYNNDICINLHWDGERDGEYEAYSAHTYPLDSDLVLRGVPKLDSANKLYYDGDVYHDDGTVDRNMTDVTVTSNMVDRTGTASTGIKFAQINFPISGKDNGNLVCAKYMPIASTASSQSGYIRVNQTSCYVYDNAMTDIDTAKSLLNGLELVYELATPTTETADAFQSPQAVSNWGTEEYIDTRSIPIPVGHNTKYPPDLKAKLETSPNPPDADGDYIVRQTNGVNEYVALSTNATIQNIISRLEALEG